MIKYIIVLFTLSLGTSLSAQDASSIFEKYQKMEDSWKFEVNQDMLDMISTDLIGDLASKIDLIEIVISDAVEKTDEKGIVSSLRADNFEELINMRDEGNKVKIFIQEDEDLIKSLFLVAQSKDGDNVLARLKGGFTIEDIANINFDEIGLEKVSEVFGTLKP